MAKKPLKLDEVGCWSEVKLEIVRKYAKAYSTILATRPFIKAHLYVDAFAVLGELDEKVSNDAIAEAFRRRLQEVAGFAYVPPPMPMRNSKGAVVYYLYFASQVEPAGTIVTEIFEKYRDVGVA